MTTINHGEELKRVRLALGWRLVDMAEVVGLSAPYLSEVERGRKALHAAITPERIGMLIDAGADVDGLYKACLASAMEASPWTAPLSTQE